MFSGCLEIIKSNQNLKQFYLLFIFFIVENCNKKDWKLYVCYLTLKLDKMSDEL